MNGVHIKELVRHCDERGFFSELIRETDDIFSDKFGQLSYSTVYQGIVKAWHGHKYQYQWTTVLSGALKIALYDDRPNSETYKEIYELTLGDANKPLLYGFEPGILHGYKCINGPATVLYVTSGTYDLEDEIRVNIGSIDYTGFTQKIV